MTRPDNPYLTFVNTASAEAYFALKAGDMTRLQRWNRLFCYFESRMKVWDLTANLSDKAFERVRK
jgi:hypothetical protein